MKPIFITICFGLLATSAAFSGRNDNEALKHPYEGFTQPYRTIQVAAGDSERVVVVHVKDGQSVRKGQPLLDLDTSILEASRKVARSDADATAKIEALRVELGVRKRRLEQFQALEERGHGSPEELTRAQADEQVALFNLKQAEEEREKFRFRLEEIDARIRARKIVSPIDGIVTTVHREVGEFVAISAPDIATVVELSRLRAVFYLPTHDALRLSKGQSIRIHLVETRQTVTGKVELVSQTTEADSGRVLVRILIDNEKRTYRSGLRCLLDQSYFRSNVPIASQAMNPARTGTRR